MKRLLFILAFMLLTAYPALATTIFFDNSITDCVGTYNPTTRACGTGTDISFDTPQEALAAIGYGAGSGANDFVYGRTGTYVPALPIGGQNMDSFPSGTSWAAPFTFAPYNCEVVTIRANVGTERNIWITGNRDMYAIIGSETFGCGFVVDGTNTEQIVIGGNSVNTGYVRLVGNKFITTNFGSTIGTSSRSPGLEIRNNEVTGGLFDNNGANAIGIDHAMYLNSNGMIIEGNYIHDIPGYGIHVYCSGFAPPACTNNIIRRNRIINVGTGTPTVAGIVALPESGGGNRIYDNVIANIAGLNNDGGSGIGVRGVANVVHDNSVSQFTWIGVEASGGSATIIKNNIVYTTAGTSAAADQIIGGSSPAISNNLGRLAHANIAVVGNPGFTNATTGDLTLTGSASPAIDAGVASIGSCPAPFNCTYTAVHNGSLPDIGAFETIPFASATATTTSVLDITFGAAYAPLSTVASCANVTVRQAAATKTCTSFVNNGNATYRWTCAACLTAGGGTIDIAISAGKFTDGINIGGTLNQSNFALPTTTVTNNISGASEVFTVLGVRQRTYGRAVTDTVAPAWLKAENAIGTVRVDNGKFAGWWLIGCTGVNCPSVGFQFEFNLNGGAWANITDSCITNAVCFDSTNSAAPHGTVIPDGMLTNPHGNYLSGAVAAQANSYPVLDLALNQATAIQLNGAIKTGLVAGTDRICARPKLDSGVAMTHNQTLCVDVVNPAGSPA